MANATDQDWDITNPVTATSKANEGAAEIRMLRASVGDRLTKEHVAPAASGVGGQHKAGSAFAFYNADPVTNITTTLDAVALAVGDNGRLAVDSDGPYMMVYVHPAWADLAYLKLTGGTLTGTTNINGTLHLEDTRQLTGDSTASIIVVSTTAASGAISITTSVGGSGINISHNSTGTGCEIVSTGTGLAIDINHDKDTATDVILSKIDGKNTSGAGDITGQKIYAQTDTGDAIVFSVDASNTGGTGTEILFDFTAGEAGELAGHTKTGANAYATTTSGGGTFTCTGYIQIRDDAGNLKYIPYGNIANT